MNKFILILSINLMFGICNNFAADRTWNGNVSSDWSNPLNWTGGLPGSGDNAIIPSVPTGGRMPIINSGTIAITSLTIQAGATLTQAGGQLQLTNAAGTITINGSFNQTGGVFLSNLDIYLPTGSSLNQSGTGVIHLASTITATPKRSIILTGGNLNQSGGTLEVNKIEYLSASSLINQTGGTMDIIDLKFSSPGTFNQSGSSSLVKISGDYKNNGGGTFNSTGGTIQFTGLAGKSNVTTFGTNQFHNVVIDPGITIDFDKPGRGNINIAGSFTNYNTTLDVAKISFTFNGSGDQTIYSAATPLPANTTFGDLIIDKPSGTIRLLSDIAVENTFTETSGNLNLNGHTLWVSGTPLPVELSSFSATIIKNGIKLQWRTLTEVSNFGFEVQRSVCNIQNPEWEKIGFVEGHGNTNSPKDYSFTDEGVTNGRYSYRLKQIDTDGRFEFSKTIEINFGSPINYELSQNYPNPFNPVTTIRFNLPSTGMVTLTVYNSIGELIDELINEEIAEGIHTINFNAENLPSGTYYYRLQTNEYIQTRKMMLLK